LDEGHASIENGTEEEDEEEDGIMNGFGRVKRIAGLGWGQ